MIPESKEMPCCTPSDYNHESFHYWPWTRGPKGHPHTGVDIFGKKGTRVNIPNGGIVIYSGYLNKTAESGKAFALSSRIISCIFPYRSYRR